ncbi:hypothetical protein PR202_ga26272 [Eleusine coracana subsp. coracana]|uniref:AAA+ ATPase domain-containing protein n=1 Tax=Eleusine coracana subsp. coracana TaxID=191504 RepID=A0AAV5DDJ9_ELECO|nr:hypothetical protein PR202_ga26272 [Eleusine coracana subsp. coracana]
MQRTAGTADADAEGARVELGVELKGAVGRAAASGRGGRAGEGGGSVSPPLPAIGSSHFRRRLVSAAPATTMEVDMDMDMPDLEELEWMESHSFLPEEEEEAYFDDPEAGFFPLPGDSPQPQEAAAPPAKHAVEVSEGGQKRPPPPPPLDQERSKRINLEREDSVDEEWLRYSPPPAPEVVVAETTISRFASEIQGDCVPVTAPNGERVYAKLEGDGLVGGGARGTRQGGHISNLNLSHKGLLSESFQSLTRRAEQEALAKVLLWIKQWDSCVFGSHIRATSGDVLSALRRHSSTVQKNSSSRNFFYKGKGGTATSQNDMPLNASNGNPEGSVSSFSKRPSADNTPEQKVLLLCGPPGLGKTTLAHVAAKHCGYHVMEINASDDRSASSIESKILDVVQMNSIMSDSKPKCLIIDEIDGALGDGKGAVEVILKMINAEKNNNADSSTTDEIPGRKASSRKSHRSAKLLRPVSIEAMALASVYFGYSLILQKKKLKRAGKTENHFTKDNGIDSLFSLISNRGDYEVTMDGIHENFLRLSYHDPMLKKTVKCIDVLGISDCLTQYVWRTQQMSLQAYQPLIAINISRMVAQVEKPNIEWPKASQRCRTMLLEKKDMLKTWQKPNGTICFKAPVALNLLSEREKKELVQIVDTMVSYSVTYKNTKFQPQEKPNVSVVSHDVHSLSFDPPINDIIRFKGYQSEHIGLSLAMKQVLLHEVTYLSTCKTPFASENSQEQKVPVLINLLFPLQVEKQRIIKGSAGKLLSQTNGEDVKGEAVSATREKATNDPVAPTLDSSKDSFKRNSTTLQMQLKPSSNLSGKDPTPAKKHSGRSTNFFERFRKERPVDAKTRNDAGQHGATVQRDSRPLIFKYNEGFTNAVKRPVRVRDLLLS